MRDAERSKARILEVPGKFHEVDHNPDNFKNDFLNRMSGEFAHSMLVDEEFSMVASHVDEATRRKIANTEYMDFVRLLPRDEIAVDQESGEVEHFVMVNKGGQSFWAPENQVASARRDQGANISSINK